MTLTTVVSFPVLNKLALSALDSALYLAAEPFSVLAIIVVVGTAIARRFP